jgi:hypothetical protein
MEHNPVLAAFAEAIDLDEVIANPHKFGAPTLEEFCRDPGKWREPANHIWDLMDDSKTKLKKILRKKYYKVVSGPNEYKTDTIEKAFTICQSEGINTNDIVWLPEIVQYDSMKMDIVITIKSKARHALDGGTERKLSPAAQAFVDEAQRSAS